MSDPDIQFLTLAEILEIHRDQLELYGGEEGIRDLALLSSAIAIPRSTFDAEYLHHDLFQMSSAYIYHISQNNPFIDGNKRVALVAGLVFLEFNGITLEDPDGELYSMMMRVASGNGNKDYITEILRKLSE